MDVRICKILLFAIMVILITCIPATRSVAYYSSWLTPLIHDNPSELILPAAFFFNENGGISIIDAGNNAGVIKRYDDKWNLLSSEVTSFPGDDNLPPLSGFNPFGSTIVKPIDDGFLFVREADNPTVISHAISENVYTTTVDNGLIVRPVLGEGPERFFGVDGLYDESGDRVLRVSLEGMLKLYRNLDEDIYAISARGISKFNRFGIPVWHRSFPRSEEGEFVSTSLTVTSDRVFISGVALPPGIDASEFLVNYPEAFCSSPSVAVSEHLNMYTYVATEGTPLLISYALMDGKVLDALEFDRFPMWLSSKNNDPYILSISENQAFIMRFTPDLADSIELVALPLGKRSVEGTSNIEFSDDSILFDYSNSAYSEEGEFSEELLIYRRRISDAETNLFLSKSAFEGGYLVSGMDSSPDGTIYLAGTGLGNTRDASQNRFSAFLDVYSPEGEMIANLLEPLDRDILPAALAVSGTGEIILAMVEFSGSLSNPWALRFSSDGNLINEYFFLGGGINKVNMVGGGAMGIARDGTIYQCDNIFLARGEPYMRKFHANGKFIENLGKLSVVGARLLGVEEENIIYSWKNRYLLLVEDDEVTAQIDLGEYFVEIEPLDITSGDNVIYIFAEDRIVYSIDENSIRRSGFHTSEEVEEAAETLRSIVLDHIFNHFSPPEELDDILWTRFPEDTRIDDVMAHFFGSGPFDYRFSGRDDFSFMLFGRDPYQTVYLVRRDGVDELEW